MHYLAEAKSLGHLFALSCAHWGEKTSHIVPGKGGHREVSFNELWETACRYATVLRELGLKKGDRMVIFGENSFEWALADWAAQTLGVCPVPIYPSLPPDQAQYIATDSGAKVALCGVEELRKRLDGLQGVPVLLLSEIAERAANATFDKDQVEADIAQISMDDLATIIYTSGTTGNPKGVMLTHSNFVFCVQNVIKGFKITNEDTFFSFLPLSHVYERTDGHVLPTCVGATVGYMQSYATLANDFLRIRPTVMCAVPRFLEAFRGRILDGVTKTPPVRQKLFHWAIAQGTKRFKGEFAPFYGLTDKLVGEKVRARLGGRFRFFCSGGAALPSQVAEFFGAFNVLVLQGYGLTETSSGMCFNPIDDNRYKTVGMPLPGAEMKTAEDGEILIRGKWVMKGYYNLPEATAEAIDSDGWFHTGDIGEQLPSGHWVITDRKKDLLVLGNGKNVAPQPIENKLKESPYISEAVLLGDGMEYVCGLVIPDFQAIAGKLPNAPTDPALAIEDDAVKKLLKEEIHRINATLANFEKLKRYKLINAVLSVEGGELTPSLKVKRRVIKEKFAAEIAELSREG
ncbi:MAG: long-chain fatty acid--CoA ligase [Chthonomonas sp.]|nr:long-chain fatty acid--CoA ligase [Chthonomonas sp.]